MAQYTPPLYRLLYRSRQAPEVAANLDFVVGEIIGSAIRQNRAVGLTGLLLVMNGHFIQALEGGVNAVRTTYARISMDPRHHNLRILSQRPAEGRLFSDWYMCAQSLAPSDKAILSVLGSRSNFNPEALTPDSTERLLTTVASIQRRTAQSAVM